MFRSYQTILREMSCLVVKLLKVARFCAPLVMQQHAFGSGYVPPFVVDVSVARSGLTRPKHVGVLIILISECFKVYS